MKFQKNRNSLRRAQRISAIRITPLYRTTSTDATLLLEGTIPWPLLVRERVAIHRKNRRRNAPYDSEEKEEPSRAEEDIEGDKIEGWQQARDLSAKGRWTHACTPKVRRWFGIKRGELNGYTTQVLTGHGNFHAYLYFIGEAPSPIDVLCDSGEEGHAHHTTMGCRVFERQITRLMATDVLALIEQVIGSEEVWTRASRSLSCIMEEKDVLHRQDRI